MFTGSKSSVLSKKGKNTKIIDLKGKCLMPGFFDPHSHVVLQSVKFSVANLDPKPIGEAGSIEDIKNILKTWITEKKPKKGEWIIGWGYDDTGITDARHPNRDDLDEVSKDHPILLMHISAHLMTGNSKMLEITNLNAKTPDPDGGVIQRRAGSNEPNGVLEENAMMLTLKHLPMPTPEQAIKLLEAGIDFYAEAGITTAQDCASSAGTVKLLRTMEESGKLPIDIITWPVYRGLGDELFNEVVKDKGKRGRLRLGGIKLTIDGSIQGYTAFLSEPYHVQPGANVKPVADKCDSKNAEHLFIAPDLDKPDDSASKGYASMTQENIDGWVKRCDENNVSMQVHCNGDAATDLLINAIKKHRSGKNNLDLRTNIIHAQTMREDQLDFTAKNNMTVSFFPIHVYFWGDRHRDIFLGPKRAERINPSRSALKRNIKVSLHHDAPIAGISMLQVAWASVNRVTSSGKKLGEEQCITPYEAMRAITIDSAWQNFEEDRKGTLEVNKLADLVILSDDPLIIDPMKIREIKVLETIKEGKTVFSKNS